MASPLQFYTIRDCGLQVETLKADFSDWRERFDQDFRSSPMKYRLKNDEDLRPSLVNNISGFEKSLFEGLMSPTSPLTLSEDVKICAGIPSEAKRFAYIHPPISLSQKINTEVASGQNPSFRTHLTRETISSFALLGGFVYLDEEYSVVSVNVLSRKKTHFKYNFSGPWNATQEATDEMQDLRRTSVTQLGTLQEAGFVSYGWVHPNEKFQSKPVSYEHQNNHGAMLFLRDNGTAVVYIVDQIPYLDLSGEVGAVAEAFKVAQDDTEIHLNFSRESMNYKKIIKWRDGFLSRRLDEADLIESLLEDDKKTLIHKAFHARLDSKVILKLLIDSAEENLLHKDKFSWTPLHYACRFTPGYPNVIKKLIELCPRAVLEADSHGRYPLHLACESDIDEEVIISLLEADESNRVIMEKTRNLGRLPIHFACKRGASAKIIQLLLDADTDGKTIYETSTVGHLALHYAILNKVPVDIVKKLIDADTKVKTWNKNELDVYHESNGMLPLHIACWNRSCAEVVSLLLQKDDRNTSIDKKVGHCNDSFNNVMEGMLALHLSVKYGSSNVVRLLLQKEIQKERNVGEISTVHTLDAKQRCPLHIACEGNVDTKTIRLLLGCDPKKSTIYFDDDQHLKPLHYLCTNHDASAETMRILLESESATKGESAKSFDKGRRTPLRLAVSAGVNEECIKMLLHPNRLTFKGLSPSRKQQLAISIALSETLQDEILETLTKRSYLSILLLQFYMNIGAIAIFINVSDTLLIGEDDDVTIQLRFLYLIASYYILREILQIISEGALLYLIDFWSWVEIILSTLLIICIQRMDTYSSRDADLSRTDRRLFLVTGLLLMVEFITLLRATLYPIARFLLGVFKIFRVLIPFFVVTATVLLGFAYWLRLGESTSCSRMRDCIFDVLAFFFNGQEKMNSIFDVIFATVVGIILLNVVIAIVSEAWSSADKASPRMFWYFRLDYIGEASAYDYLTSNLPFDYFEILFNYIDNLDTIQFWDGIHWFKAPYNMVKSKDQYLDPYKYWSASFAENVKNARSLQADLFWLGQEFNETNNSVKFYCEASWVVIQYIVCVVLKLLLFILGFFTLGLLWPKSFRCKLLKLWLPKADYNEMDYRDSLNDDETVINKRNASRRVISSTTLMRERHISLRRVPSSEHHLLKGLVAL